MKRMTSQQSLRTFLVFMTPTGKSTVGYTMMPKRTFPLAYTWNLTRRIMMEFTSSCQGANQKPHVPFLQMIAGLQKLQEEEHHQNVTFHISTLLSGIINLLRLQSSHVFTPINTTQFAKWLQQKVSHLISTKNLEKYRCEPFFYS